MIYLPPENCRKKHFWTKKAVCDVQCLPLPKGRSHVLWFNLMIYIRFLKGFFFCFCFVVLLGCCCCVAVVVVVVVVLLLLFCHYCDVVLVALSFLLLLFVLLLLLLLLLFAQQHPGKKKTQQRPLFIVVSPALCLKVSLFPSVLLSLFLSCRSSFPSFFIYIPSFAMT